MHKNIPLITASLIFSLLFFKQNIGLNFLLFSIITLLLLSAFNLKKIKTQKVLIASGCFLLASVFVFIYNSTLTIVTASFTFFYLLGTLSEEKSSTHIQLLNGLYSSIAAGFYLYYHKFIDESKAVKKRNINYIYWLKMIGIPLLVVLVFTILYRSANPYFNELLNKIDFSFINLQWVLFTVFGYFLLVNLTNPLTIETITENDLNTSNLLNRESIKPQPNDSIDQENQLGTVLLVLLNMLIVFFLTTDILYLSKLTDLNAIDLSKTVHEGVYALITSIVFAIALILYFFRGNLNFYAKNKRMKTLTTIWILLNITLIIITAYKNSIYVNFHGLTYKRIGVFIYLILALIGLITTYIKVYATLNFWFLCRRNISIGFTALIISTTVNWDKLITKYNTLYSENTDFDYLINLSDNNTLALKEYANGIEIPISIKRKIDHKFSQYYETLENNNWQELVYDNLILKP